MSRVQTIVDQELKIQAEKMFNDLGLNLSEGVRFILTNFVNGNITVTFNQPVEEVRLGTASKKKYRDITEDIKKGENLMDITQLD